MNFLIVFAGGGAGCVARYLIGLFFQKQSSSLPFATLASNLTACIIFALVIWAGAEKNISAQARLLLLTGFCGGLSTFSTFGYETFLLLRQGQTMAALLNIIVSVSLCTFIFYFFRAKT